MPKQHRSDAGQRLHLKLTASWAFAWVLGIACLGTLAISMNARLLRVEFEDSLRLRAMAVYGLTWFDVQGRFHDELLRKEPGILTGNADIWVVAQQPPGAILLKPERAKFSIGSPIELANTYADTDENSVHEGRDNSGKPFLLLAKTTYDDADRVVATILVLGDTNANDAAHAAFVRNLLLAMTALALIGLAVGNLLARQALRPLAQTMEIRERLIAASAHELRAPVANLLAICDSVAYGDTSPEDGFPQVRHVARTSAALVDKLLLLAQLDSSATGLTKEKVRLDLIVEAALPEDGGISTDMDESVVYADKRLLQIAVRNLIENALIHGRVGTTSARVSITVRDGVFTIEDEGAGFPGNQSAHMREPFRKSPGSSGSGLGLSIVQHIADLHGGQLTLENRTPRGARARLRIS
jgi:signal transduction histidine kinase